MTKYILGDIDGVFNALSPVNPKNLTDWLGTWGLEVVDGGAGKSYSIRWSHEMVEEMNRIISKPDVQFIVASTWQDQGKNVLFPTIGLHLPEDTIVFKEATVAWGYSPMGSNLGSWWKLDEFKEFYAHSDSEDSFIWLDDDIKKVVQAIQFVNERDNITAISPFQSLGLTREDLELLDRLTD